MRDTEPIFPGSAFISGGFVVDLFDGLERLRVLTHYSRHTDVRPLRGLNRTLRKSKKGKSLQMSLIRALTIDVWWFGWKVMLYCTRDSATTLRLVYRNTNLVMTVTDRLSLSTLRSVIDYEPNASIELIQIGCEGHLAPGSPESKSFWKQKRRWRSSTIASVSSLSRNQSIPGCLSISWTLTAPKRPLTGFATVIEPTTYWY